MTKKSFQFLAVYLTGFLSLGIVEIYNALFFELYRVQANFTMLPDMFFVSIVPIIMLYLAKGLMYYAGFICLTLPVWLCLKASRLDDLLKNRFCNSVATFVFTISFIYLFSYQYKYKHFMESVWFPIFFDETTVSLLQQVVVWGIAFVGICLFLLLRACGCRKRLIAALFVFSASSLFLSVFSLINLNEGHAVLKLATAGIISIGCLLLSAGVYYLLQGRRSVVLTCLLALPLLTAASLKLSAAAPKPATPYNVVLIVLDTLRMSSFTPRTMPFLTGLRKNTVFFPNSYSNSNNTTRTHSSLFLGKYLSTTGYEIMPGREQSLAEILRLQGYYTAAVPSNPNISFYRSFDQGFTDFYAPWLDDNHENYSITTHNEFPERFAAIHELLRLYTRIAGCESAPLDKTAMGYRDYAAANYEPAPVINRFAGQVLSSRPRHKPFFLFLNYLEPHFPYLAADEKYIDMFTSYLKKYLPDLFHVSGLQPSFSQNKHFFGKMGSFSNWYAGDEKDLNAIWNLIQHYPDKEARDRLLLESYHLNISYLDVYLRELFTMLEKAGVMRETFIIITSDHGESFGEHGIYRHGHKHLYNTEIQVPLMMILPDRFSPSREHKKITVNTQTVDIVPTILDMLGLDAPADLDGTSLLQYAFGGTDTERFVIAQCEDSDAIMGDRFKLVLTKDVKMLYDLRTDPQEEEDIAAAHPDIVARMAEQLTVLKSRAPHAGQAPQLNGNAPLMDEHTKKKLRKLGYIN